MPISPYTRLLFAHLIPGATLAGVILFLVDVPAEDGFRISLLEWSMDSDRVFPYVVAIGLVASVLLGSVLQAVRLFLVDPWALPAPPRSEAATPLSPGAPAETADPPAPDAAPLPPRAPPPGRPPDPGPLAELYANSALAVFVALVWVTIKIIRGGGTEIFPLRLVLGVPFAGAAACVLLYGAYRRESRHGHPGGVA